MKLPIPFFNNKKDDLGYYLALILDDEKAGSIILEEVSGTVKIVGKHTEHFTSPLETIPQEELIKIIDRTISKAEEVLPPNIETHKTVFGVKESWIEQDTKKIKKEYLARLKKVCDALDLSPIGFMVINEAIANLAQHEEGSPLSAILVEVGKKEAYVTLFRGGKVSEATSGPIEHSIPTTIDTLLKNFTAPVLPTKIFLLNTKDAKELSQHFMNHEWSKSLPFLHVPQVSVLPQDYETRAVTYGAASQMGFKVVESSEKTPDQEDNTQTKSHDIVQEENFGFVLDQDISKQPIAAPASEITQEEELKEPDRKMDDEPEKSDDNTKNESFHVNLKQDHEQAPDEDSEAKHSGPKEKGALFGILSGLPKISIPQMKNISDFFTKNKSLKMPAIIIGSILIIGIIFSLFYFYGVKAQIVLSVKPNEVTQEENITFSASAGNDFSKNIIAAKNISASIDGELSTPATGKKDTGDKAKGNVTIYNSDDSPSSLSSGTEIKSSNGVTFSIDKDVKLASASGDIFSGTKPGTATVGVTAKDIGTESNLPSNTKFTIGGNSSLAGKNDSAFSGGTKKTITVVSKNDIAKLRSDLPKKLEKDAVTKLSESKNSDMSVLPGFVKVSITEEDFDKDVDDEAKQVKLTASVKFEGMIYQNNDLEDFDKSVLKDKYSQDISFADKSLKNEVRDAKANGDDEIKARLKITAGLLPKIDNNEVVGKLKNKSPGQAKEILSTLPQVAGSEIKFSPNIFFLSNLFPTLPNNISVVVKSDE